MENINIPSVNSNNFGASATFETKVKPRDRAVSDMRYLEYLRNYGIPPAPLFQPQNAPNETLGEMELPPSELIEKDFRKILSCPVGFSSMTEDEGNDEEEERDIVDLPEKPVNIRNTSNIEGSAQSQNDEILYGPFAASSRYRSRSENLNNGSIFKFLENSTGGRRDHANLNLLY